MRHAVVLLLLCAPGVAQEKKRSVAEVLNDHAVALGRAAGVKTLRATGRAGAAKGIRTKWRLADGLCVRDFPTGRAQLEWKEYFGSDGAFISRGLFERFRPNQITTRGTYYMLKTLAEPFPLLKYISDPQMQKLLEVGRAKGKDKVYEVLFTRRDRHGVRAVYFIDPKTHLVENVRHEAKDNDPFSDVVYSGFRMVDGVMLPHDIWARFRNYFEDPAKRAIRPRAQSRAERIDEWEIDPDLSKAGFSPPGLGRGGGRGFERSRYATGPDPYTIAVGDLDADGLNDIAVACFGAVYVHFGGALDAPVRVPLGEGHHHGLVIEDLDFDGWPELVTGSNVAPHQRLMIVSFDADRNSKVRTIFGAPHFTYDLLATDLDLDGIPDLIASGQYSQDIQIKFGNGMGGVRRVGLAWPLESGKEGVQRGFGIDVGDVNDDGVKDIAVADGTRVVIFMGRLNLTFHPQFAVPKKVKPGKPWRPVDVRFADLNGDGKDDLVIAREHPLRDLTDDVVTMINTGKSYKATAAVNAGARVQSIATGYFDGDEHVDVAAVSFLTGELSILRGDGKGGLKRPEKFQSDRGASRLTVTDFDGDGKDDVLVSNRLGDSFSIFLNRRDAFKPKRPRSRRAVVAPPPTKKEFDLKGLTDPQRFRGEFRLPLEIQDPSGLVVLGSEPGQPAQLMLVSDKRSALFRATLDRFHNRLLVGPAIPLRGLEGERLDLEGVAWDQKSGSIFLGAEADSTIIRTNIFGHVLGRAKSGIESTGNDGIEGLAFRRLKDGTPLLYVFKERHGITGRQPGVDVYGLEEEPFALKLRHKQVRLPMILADQSGATVLGESLFTVSRLARGIVEVPFVDDLFAKSATGVASFAKLTDRLLGIRSPKMPLFGNVEAIAFDGDGDLYLLVDNNRETIGIKGVNRGAEGRLLWFENKGETRVRANPQRVEIVRIVIPDGEGAEDAARETLRRARKGEDFDRLAEEVSGERPKELSIVTNAVRGEPGELRVADAPVALGRLAFNLHLGEIGLCEYDPSESPEGWVIVLRTK